MRSATKQATRSTGHVVRQQFQMCRMNPISNCGRLLDPTAERNRGVGKRENCDSCYVRSAEEVREGRIKEEELVRAGYWAENKRGFQKRLLSTMIARRQTA